MGPKNSVYKISYFSIVSTVDSRETMDFDTVEETIIHELLLAIGDEEYYPLVAKIKGFAHKYHYNRHSIETACRRHRQFIQQNQHGNRIMDDAEELHLATLVVLMSRLKVPIFKNELCRLIEAEFHRRVTKSFVNQFLKRWGHVIKMTKGKKITKQRVTEGVMDELIDFCNKFEFLIEHHDVQAKNLVNVDESRVAMGRDGSLPLSVLCARDRSGGNCKMQFCAASASVIPFVSAMGEIVCIFIVVKGGASEDSAMLTAYERSGYVNRKLRIRLNQVSITTTL